MTSKQMSTAANRINTRLSTARVKYSNSSFTNEMERRIIELTAGTDLLVITSNGPQLSRSKAKWAKVPEGRAQGILDEILAMGSVQMMEHRVDTALEDIGVEANKENRESLIEGTFNSSTSDSRIWEIAYNMRSQNQALYDMFYSMRGKSMDNWDKTFDEYTEELRKQILYGDTDDVQRPGYGPNYRKMALESVGRKLAYMSAKDPAQVNPDTMAQLFQQYGQAFHGVTDNGNFNPADYSQLSPDEVRKILKKFLKSR